MFQLSKKKIIIGISIWVGAIVLTITLTLLNNKEQPKEDKIIVEEKKEELKDNPYKTTVYETYDNNDLEAYEYKVDDNFSYHQIKYLKDNKLQRKINEMLHDRAKNLYNKIKKYENQYFYSNVEFNANGLLSISFFAKGTDEKDRDTDYFDSLNINLSTGEELELKDLFYDEQQMFTAYTKAAAYDIATTQVMYDGDKLKTNNVANMEDKIFKYINEIKKGNYSFSFSRDTVTIYVDGFLTTIPVMDYLDNTVFFKKYIPTKDLFTGEYKAIKNIYIFSLAPLNTDYYNVKEVNDNLFLDVHMDIYELNKKDNKDSMIKNSTLEEYINKLINSANIKKYTIISGAGNIDYFNDYNFYTIDSKFVVCNSDIKNKNYMLKKMVAAKKKNFDMYANLVYIDNKNVKCKEYDYAININTDKKKIITIDNIFKEGYDYKSVLKNEFVTYCTEYDSYTTTEAEEMWNSGKIKLSLNGELIEIEYDGEYYTDYKLKDFDKSNLAI